MATRLLLLNGVAIICVILFHATGFGFTAMFAWAHRYRDVAPPNYDAVGSGWYYALRVVEQLITFCIPAFLFVSGYFVSVLAGRDRGWRYSGPLSARVRTLIVPYLVWSAVILVALALEGRVLSWHRYLRLLLTGSMNPNYYFVPLLVQLYLSAPAVVLLARLRPAWLLAGAACVQVLVYSLQYHVVVNADLPGMARLAGFFPKWLFLTHFFWFVFGVTAGLYAGPFKALMDRWRPVLPVAVAVFFVLGVVEWELLIHWSGMPWRENRTTLVDGLYAGAVIMWFLEFADVPAGAAPSLSALGSRSYGIYLVHGIAMEYFSRGVYHMVPWLLGKQALFQPMLIAVGLTVPLLLMVVVRRSSLRGFYSTLFG